ncbi:hypothetical protein QEG73_01830 [Chitinophagaceae bacterium 26-R-25]|nr:hypothetical protein [Chitinophagaceae bacterium 26-R-25]
MKKIVFLACCLGLLVSCKRNDDNGPRPVMQITPELLMGYVGQNYSAVESSLKDKKDYLYTKLNPSTQMEAAISLPVIDPNAPAQHYNLLLNLQDGNIIKIVGIENTDTLTQALGNKNFLYFYQHTALKASNVVSARQWVMPPNNPNTMVTQDSLVKALQLGVAPQPTLSWYIGNGQLELVYFGGFRMTVN